MDGGVQERMASDFVVYFGSPLKGIGTTEAAQHADFIRNMEWAKDHCRELVTRGGVTPYAPHAFFPQFLRDEIEEERWAGMGSGIVMLKRCDEAVFYPPPWRETFSSGMMNDRNKAGDFRVTTYSVRDEKAWAEYLYHLRQRLLSVPMIRVS